MATSTNSVIRDELGIGLSINLTISFSYCRFSVKKTNMFTGAGHI